jgi:hypothetical protein
MELARDQQGVWTVDATEGERAQKGDYVAELEEYLNTFDGLFQAAQGKDEFQFILSLLGIRGVQAAGWDAFENTVNAIDAAVLLHNEASDAAAAAHLRLWIYGHIVEASEPYELIANLLDVIDGGTFEAARFPDQNSKPQSPGAKTSWIEQRATKIGVPQVAEPFRSRWDRVLRNSIFHSDYALHSQEIRLVSAGEVRSQADLNRIVAVANASHDALVLVRRCFIESYTEPADIPTSHFSADPSERALIVIRGGEGLVGLRHVPTGAPGEILWRMTRGCSAEDNRLLDADPALATLPRRPGQAAAAH